jgi:ATP-dependent Clp protease ATP-binding subunit ClpB
MQSRAAKEETEYAISQRRKSIRGSASSKELDTLSFFTDLTAEAKSGKFDPVFCRSKELDEIYRILSRNRRNCVWLVGEPKVGKFAIVRELARQISNQETADFLKGSNLYKVSLTGFDWPRYFQMAEDDNQDMINIYDEHKKGNICYMDCNEINLNTTIELPNFGLLLNNPYSFTIVSSTKSQFDDMTKEYPYLLGLFETINVEPLDTDDTITCLRGLRHSLELRHKICISDDALVTAATLSQRYFKNEISLTKSLEILDSLGEFYGQEFKEISQWLKIKRAESDEFKTNFLSGNRIWNADRVGYDTMSEVDLYKDKQLKKLRDDESWLEAGTNFYVMNKEFFKKYEELLIELIELDQQSSARDRLPEQKDIGYFRSLRIQGLLGLIDSYYVSQQYFPFDEELVIGDYPYPAEIGSYLDYKNGLPDQEFEAIKESLKKIEYGFEPNYVIESENVRRFISKITGVKISDPSNSDRERYLKMEEILGERVKGQNEAISQISTALRRARFGLNDPNRPLGTFLFLGRTGVGKTELAKALADFLFDDEKAMVRLDMSEFTNEYRVSTIIGSPRGYYNSEMGGALTEAVKKTPECVVLLDEIEKAHPSVYNIFLQVFDDGRLTDGSGETVDFTKTLIIMTSNLGSKTLSKNSKRAGFGVTEDSLDKKQEFERAAMKELRERMSTEFINRIDSQVFFNPLEKKVIKEIAEKEFTKLGNRLLDNKNITLHPDEAAIGLAVEKGYDQEMGARPLRRLIEQVVGNLIVDECLRLGYEKDVDIAISATDGENPQFKLTITPKVTERSPEFQR